MGFGNHWRWAQGATLRLNCSHCNVFISVTTPLNCFYKEELLYYAFGSASLINILTCFLTGTKKAN